MIFMKREKAFVFHFAQFFRQSAAVEVQIVCQLVSIEWNVEFIRTGEGTLSCEINGQSAADRLW